MAENDEQRRIFTETLQEKVGVEDVERSQFLTERKYEEVCTALEEFHVAESGNEKKEVQKAYSQVYAWAKKYELVAFESSKVLVLKDEDSGDSDTQAFDRAKVVSHRGRVFDDLLKIHLEGGHCKAKTFQARILTAHGKSIPRWVAETFVNCCPTCVRRLPRKPSSAGYKPILTQGLGSRGQVDLIDFQSCPDMEFKFLLNYQDHGACLRPPPLRSPNWVPVCRLGHPVCRLVHSICRLRFPPSADCIPSAHSVCKLSLPCVQTAGIKLCDNRPLTSKRNSAIAFALLDIFTVYGAPAILQSDNGREFQAVRIADPNPNPNPNPNPDPDPDPNPNPITFTRSRTRTRARP